MLRRLFELRKGLNCVAGRIEVSVVDVEENGTVSLYDQRLRHFFKVYTIFEEILTVGALHYRRRRGDAISDTVF